jgi:hypothetical protein
MDIIPIRRCVGVERTRDAVPVPHDEIKELLYLRLVPPSFLTTNAVDTQIMWRYSLG